MTDLIVRAYRSSTRRQWIVYRESARIFGSYRRGDDSTRALAAELGVTVESIGNWAKAGWLRQACRGMTYQDTTGREWTFYDLRRALTAAHFQIMGRALHREEVDPEGAFEWLCLAAAEGMSAEKMASEVMPAESQFLQRMARLLDTPLPDSMCGQRRREFLVWLDAGRDLQSNLEIGEVR